jgi:hypothetical protein
MSVQQQKRSGSVAPPINAANPAASRYAASLAEGADPQEVASSAPRREGRTLSEGLTPLVGMIFLVRGAVGAYFLVKSLPHVTSTPYRGLDDSPSTGWTVAGHGFGVWWLVAAAISLASLYAGAKILKSDERGRGIGILICLAGLGLGLLGLSQGASGDSLAWLGGYAFVLWVLVASSFPSRR